jgi:hypothetical protein
VVIPECAHNGQSALSRQAASRVIDQRVIGIDIARKVIGLLSLWVIAAVAACLVLMG